MIPAITARDISPTSRILTTAVIAMVGALMLAITAQIRIPLPFTPVPVTLQVLAVIVLGGLLGARRGLLAVATYLALGVCGMPVFSGWKAGLATLSGATGGFLIGFLLAAVLAGAIADRFSAAGYGRRLLGGALASAAAILAIYLCGFTWLMLGLHLTPAQAFLGGVAPFIGIDLAKAAVAAGILALRAW